MEGNLSTPKFDNIFMVSNFSTSSVSNPTDWTFEGRIFPKSSVESMNEMKIFLEYKGGSNCLSSLLFMKMFHWLSGPCNKSSAS